jgi:hypothetical protein
MGTATAEPAISFTKQWADKHTVVRSFSIRDADGNVVFDSSSLLDREAHARGTYNDGRSRELKDKNYFSQVSIAFGAVTWPHAQDIAPETLLAGMKLVGQQDTAAQDA